ncbi:MAG: hypothetical protein H7235_07170 [Bdellovibrionaceae bacterium]|nr:hypothetical protein [Pseudobdellovibrionaceae bacterium]
MLTLFFLILTIQAQAAGLKCSSLFGVTYEHKNPALVLDKNHGLLNQNDPRLVEADLIKNKSSMLCGPTCLYNVLEKFKIERNEKNLPEQNAAELISYVKDIFSQNETTIPKLMKYGMTIGDLANSLQAVAQKNNLNLKTKVKTTMTMEQADLFREQGVSLIDLKNAIKSGRTAIVLVGFYQTGDLLKVTKINRLAGHYMIVAGHDPLNPNQIIFQDPNRPLTYKKINLLPVKPSNFSTATYQLDLKMTPWWYPRQVTTLIERVLFIEAD